MKEKAVFIKCLISIWVHQVRPTSISSFTLLPFLSSIFSLLFSSRFPALFISFPPLVSFSFLKYTFLFPHAFSFSPPLESSFSQWQDYIIRSIINNRFLLTYRHLLQYQSPSGRSSSLTLRHFKWKDLGQLSQHIRSPPSLHMLQWSLF